MYAFVFLAASLLWPIWVEAHGKSPRAKKKMHRRFVDEMNRLMLFGGLAPDRHQELREKYGKPAER